MNATAATTVPWWERQHPVQRQHIAVNRPFGDMPTIRNCRTVGRVGAPHVAKQPEQRRVAETTIFRHQKVTL